MKYIGAHVSAQGGVENAPVNAQRIGANAFALFTKNQRQWNSPPLTYESIAAFKSNLNLSGIDPRHILPHDSYLINIGNGDDIKRRRSINALLDEAQRAEALGLTLLNFHPGAHLNEITVDECLTRIAQGINEVIEKTGHVIMVIENTAGMGSSVGRNFEELATIIARIPPEKRNRVGICLDTCHMYAAGYDIGTAEGFTRVFGEFERIIGFSKLKGMHLNGSKAALGKHLDRHESLGAGEIGLETFRLIMNDQRFDDMPLILETPDDTKWAEEITLLRSYTK